MKLASLLSIIPAILLANCQTTTSSGIADKPNPDLPANYRQQVAAFMRTQSDFARGGIKNAEISDPNRGWAGLINGGERDFVCVRLGGGTWGSETRVYYFADGKLPSGNGYELRGSGLLTCGANPVFKPFPEADYQPRA